MFDKAVKSGVDIVCLELEDGIAPSDKLFARQNALKIINKKKDYNNIEVLIRINSIREILVYWILQQYLIIKLSQMDC